MRMVSLAYVVQDAGITPIPSSAQVARIAATFWQNCPPDELISLSQKIQTIKDNRYYKGGLPDGFVIDEAVGYCNSQIAKTTELWKCREIAYDIKGDCIFTNIGGEFELFYKTYPLDEMGLPMLPEGAAEAFRQYLRYRHYEANIERDFAMYSQLKNEAKKEYGMALDQYRGRLQMAGQSGRAKNRRDVLRTLRD